MITPAKPFALAERLGHMTLNDLPVIAPNDPDARFQAAMGFLSALGTTMGDDLTGTAAFFAQVAQRAQMTADSLRAIAVSHPALIARAAGALPSEVHHVG